LEKVWKGKREKEEEEEEVEGEEGGEEEEVDSLRLRMKTSVKKAPCRRARFRSRARL